MKLNGCRQSHRNRWYLISEGILSQEQFCFLEFVTDICQFNSQTSTYGTFEYEPLEIAKIFRCSEDSITRWLHRLIEVGLVAPTSKTYRYRIVPFYKYQTFQALRISHDEKGKNAAEILQKMGINLQKTRLIPQKYGLNRSVTSGDKSTESNFTSKCESTFPSREQYEVDRLANPSLPNYDDMLSISELLR